MQTKLPELRKEVMASKERDRDSEIMKAKSVCGQEEKRDRIGPQFR